MWIDLLLLTLLALPTYFFGLTDHGITNTQEATRLCVAYEMQRAGEWFAPTRGGEPYIAKPPMMYWLIIGLANLRGQGVGLFDVRLTVALGGLVGLWIFYLVARRMLADPERPRSGDDAAWWAALGLGVGILFVRAARIGELDILLVPFTMLAIGAVHEAWRRSLDHGRTHWAAIALATLGSIGAAMTKGPVPTMVIALAIYAPILVHAASEERQRTPGWGIALGAVLGIVGGAIGTRNIEHWYDWAGCVLLGVAVGIVAAGLVRIAQPKAAGAWWPHLRRTHPWLVLGAGLLAVTGWVWLVKDEFGAERIGALVEDEREDNLQLLMPSSPVRNLGFVVYGILPMSLGGVCGLIWLLRDRPRLLAGQRAALVWTILGIIAFSTLGKGVARYMLPVWPALAMLGGMWIAWALQRLPRDLGELARWRALLYAIVIAAALGNAWFYGRGRDLVDGRRAPRDFLIELFEKHEIDPDRVGTFGFETPALGYYLARSAPGWSGPHLYFVDHWVDGRRGRPIEELSETVNRSDRPYWLFAPAEEAGRERRPTVEESLRAAGIRFEPVEIETPWIRKSNNPPNRVLKLLPGVPGMDY